jgi:hypothetical protein
MRAIIISLSALAFAAVSLGAADARIHRPIIVVHHYNHHHHHHHHH